MLMLRRAFRCLVRQDTSAGIVVGRTMYSTDSPPTKKTVTYNKIRTREAEKFMNNLDSEQVQKKNKIEMWMQILREKGSEVPDNLQTHHWHNLLTECNTFSAVRRYCLFLHHTQMTKLNQAEKRKQRKLEQEETEKKDRKCPYHASQKLFKYSSSIKPYLHGHPFIIDMGYDCNTREETQSRSQLEDVYGENCVHPVGFQLHFTSIDRHRQFHMQYKAGMLDPFMCYFHEKPFWELFPKERLVYLTPEGPNLRSYNGNDIYVMGGLVDLANAHDRSSYAKAKELGIRTASLPINRYGVGYTKSNALPLLYVMNIMLNLNLNGNFKKAFVESFNSPYKFSPYEDVARRRKMPSREEEIAKKKKQIQRYIRR